MKIKRVFLIVLDSFGIGELPDATIFGDIGSNTLMSISKSKYFNIPTLLKLGLGNIDSVTIGSVNKPLGAYARMTEKSMGKDTTIGHWEICGIVFEKPLPTYPNGFTKEIIKEFSNKTGRGVLCNKPYSGTQVINDYGKQHIETGDLIVYTSADSVFQIAAHENVVSIKELYEYCEIARKLLVNENAVGRVIARPFNGEYPEFKRTANRHDFSLDPPSKTLLDLLKENEYDVVSIGKINDIFNGKGITQSIHTTGNTDGMNKIEQVASNEFKGLCFANLVDFDMLYGHRNDIDGYAKAMSQFDVWLDKFLNNLKDDDLLLITGDHGCDPATPSTDHSREYTPLIIYNKSIKPINIGTKDTFSDISKSILDLFEIDNNLLGKSFIKELEI